MADIAQEFQSNYSKFEATARVWTEKFATQVKHLEVWRHCSWLLVVCWIIWTLPIGCHHLSHYYYICFCLLFVSCHCLCLAYVSCSVDVQKRWMLFPKPQRGFFSNMKPSDTISFNCPGPYLRTSFHSPSYPLTFSQWAIIRKTKTSRSVHPTGIILELKLEPDFCWWQVGLFSFCRRSWRIKTLSVFLYLSQIWMKF